MNTGEAAGRSRDGTATACDSRVSGYGIKLSRNCFLWSARLRCIHRRATSGTAAGSPTNQRGFRRLSRALPCRVLNTAEGGTPAGTIKTHFGSATSWWGTGGAFKIHIIRLVVPTFDKRWRDGNSVIAPKTETLARLLGRQFEASQRTLHPFADASLALSVTCAALHWR